MGKTMIIALVTHTCAVLYPGSKIYICSDNTSRAKLALSVLKDLSVNDPGITSELLRTTSRDLISVSADFSCATWKNGSYAWSGNLEQGVGSRANFLIVDEALHVDMQKFQDLTLPMTNWIRPLARRQTYNEPISKILFVSSGCEKGNPYFEEFMKTFDGMRNGDIKKFACCLDYLAAVDEGINNAAYFDAKRKEVPSIVWDLNYGTIFIGGGTDSAFPYQMISDSRTLSNVELVQPKNSTSRYIIALDIATSQAKGSDNAVAVVIKFTERNDGSFHRKLVFMNAFNGNGLDQLAEFIRKLYLRFPNTEKIIYDARGIGDAFDKFLDSEFTDLETGREYPPWVVDDKPNYNPNALQILHPFRAVNQLNQRIYNNLRVALEQKTLELPKPSADVQQEMRDTNEKESRDTARQKLAIFYNADALQVEMSNIVAKAGAGSNILYDVRKIGQHKDRYSALAMGNDYIAELEVENKRRKQKRSGSHSLGVAGKF